MKQPMTSTMASTLEKLKKAQENKTLDSEQAKTYCPSCGKELFPKRLCAGHGLGGGGSSGKTSEEKVEKSKSLSNPSQVIQPLHPEVALGDDQVVSQAFSDENGFNREVIQELIAKGLLQIENDPESKTLSIKLRCELHSLSSVQRKELKKFMQTVLDHLNELERKNCMVEVDNKGNILSLSITMPTLDLYNALITRLSKNVFPIPGNKESQDEDYQSMSPFSIEPKRY